MKILHLYCGGAKGGVPNAFRDTVLGLHRAGVRQGLLLGMEEDPSPFQSLGIPTGRTAFRNRFTNLVSYWAVRRLLKGFRPDILQVWPHRANWFVPLQPGVPVVRFLGGPPPARRFHSVYRHSTALMVPGVGTADHLAGLGWPRERIFRLRHFAANRNAEPLPRSDGLLVAGIGRLSPEKGFDLLVDAVREQKGVTCWLVGEGGEETALRARAGDNVVFQGWQDDALPFIASADIIVVPSREESFGLVILEAWSQGKPVIATDCDGPRELIREGETGLLVPKENPQALWEAIQRLHNDPGLRHRLGQAGQAFGQAHFSEAIAIAELIAFYKEL